MKTLGTVLVLAALAGGCKKKETEDLSAAPTPTPEAREEAPAPVADVVRTPAAVGTFAEIYFAVDSAEIAPEQMPGMERNLQALKSADVTVRIEGHADERGTEAENVALGADRANAVRAWLVSHGVEPSRMETVSFGETRPEASGEDESAWARNRRVELIGLARDDS